MLPSEHRLRRSEDFSRTIRTGRRAGGGVLVVHGAARTEPAPAGVVDGACRVGLVVGKNVGNSVVRHRVSRQVRAQVARRIADWPAEFDLVVRAQPASATATSATIGADLDRALSRLMRSTGARA